ncbi:hypothetical protein BDW02DRAFT_599161 [Decorospora gaudefroyi]|uniref:Uncharacterized protein n=1 Tax=Decorospora gaudefroyi TaxID=184978 RepID=A0A6A5KAQ0_9PLEO|nr:hypothetical protein BDW02DRAFT_599161 [Decorospora gaudefroyi]
MDPMMRPYVHPFSKSGAMVSMVTEIDRDDVYEAVAKARELRERTMDITKSYHPNTTSFLARLPPGVRNRIYELTLDVNSDLTSTTLVPRPQWTCQATTSVCFACARRRLGKHVPCWKHARKPTSPSWRPWTLANTIFTSLTCFMNAHFHLHINSHYKPYDCIGDPEPHLDLRHAHVWGILHQALLIWCCASVFNFNHFDKVRYKRKAVVHLDHQISDWSSMLMTSHSFYRERQEVIDMMGEHTTTEWELRFYMYTARPYVHVGATYARERNSYVEFSFCELQAACSQFPNITVVGEVYGPGYIAPDEEEEYKKCVVRDITASSTLWPSWPQDVSWRAFETVRSDLTVRCDNQWGW